MTDWREVEQYVLNLFKKVDPNVRLTKGTGAVFNDTDIISDQFLVEVKLKSTTEKVLILKKELQQFLNKRDFHGGISVIAMCNKSNNIFLVIPEDDFGFLMKRLRKKTYISKFIVDKNYKHANISLDPAETARVVNDDKVYRFTNPLGVFYIISESLFTELYFI